MGLSRNCALFLHSLVHRWPFRNQGALIRAGHGHAAFGDTAPQKLFYALRALPEIFWSALMVAFPMNGCLWLYRQLLMAQRLLDLVDAPRVIEVRWSAAAAGNQARPVSGLPRLDLTVPRNIQGWAALRRVVYGRNFAPPVELKMQFYVTISLFLFLLSSAANTVGAATGSSAENLPPDYVVLSILRPAVLSVPIIYQIFLAYKINRYAYGYAEALNAQSLHCAAQGPTPDAQACPCALSCFAVDGETSDSTAHHTPTAAVLSKLQADLTEVERLDRAAGMLSAAAAEIESEAESRPMRVIFIKAEPATITLIVSLIMTIIATQIYGLRGLI